MLRTALAVALTAFTLLPVACSSSSNGGGSGSDGGGSGSGSGSGGTSGPSRASATCAEAETAIGTAGTLTAGSWGNLPTAFQVTPTNGTFCGTIVTGDGGGLAATVILSSDWDQQIFDFYNPLATKAGCTLAAMTTTTGTFASSGTTFTCPGGGIGTITASSDYDFIFLTYSP